MDPILIKLRSTIQFDPESKAYVGYVPVFDIYSAAKTEGDAEKALESAVSLFVNTAEKKGTLIQILLETGFLNTGEKQFPATLVADKSTQRYFDLESPLQLAVA